MDRSISQQKIVANLATTFVFTNTADSAISLEGWSIDPNQLVQAQGGNDIIAGTIINGDSGILILDGILDTGNGNDTVSGNGGINDIGNAGFGINNQDGTISTGNGNDVITGTGGNGGIGGAGILNFGIITTGNGNDAIIGSGLYGIINYGTIMTGNGNDTITANGGIFNDGGKIATGSGNDIVDARNGGFYGSGTTDLGNGNDTLIGFGTVIGSGSFIGGRGTDGILLGDGSYTINVGAGTITDSVATTMNIAGFEMIGGLTSGLFALKSGTLTVAGGVATYS